MATDYTGYYDKYKDQADAEKKAEEVQRNPYAKYIEDEWRTTKQIADDPLEALGAQISNVPEDAWKVASETVSALNPFNIPDMVKGGVELGKAGLYKLGREFEDFYMGEETEPREGQSELVADVVMEGAADSYGSIEKIANRAINNPISMGADISIFGALPKLARLKNLNVLTGSGRATQKALNSGQRTIPERLYGQSMDIPATEQINSRLSNNVPEGLSAIREGLSESITKRPKGYQRLLDIREGVGLQIDNIIMTGMNNMQMIPTASVGKYLDGMIRDVSSGKHDLADIKALTRMRDDFYKQFGDKPNMTPKQVQEWKKSRYDKAYAGEASPLTTDKISASTVGNRQLGRGAKEGIENRLPQITEANEKYGNLSKLKPYIERAINSDLPDIGIIKTALQKLPTDRVAIILEKIAKGDMGEAEMYLNTHELRSAMMLASRTQDELEERTNIYD